MSDVLNHYNIIALSLLSNKIWEMVMMVFYCIWSAILWENMTYTTNVDDKSELFRLLKKISETYYFCSETRVNYGTYLIPCGYIIGKNYFVHIKTDMNNIRANGGGGYPTQTQIIIHVYGWFSIQSLITKDIVSDKKGKYNYITQGVITNHMMFKEDYPEHCFHKNTYVAAKHIYDAVQEQYNKSGVFLLYGIPGTGKTTTANKLFDLYEDTSYICPDITLGLSHNLMNNLIYYHNVVKPEKNKYLICVLDEVDEIIDSIFKETIVTDTKEYEKNYTKKNWNQFLEKVYRLKNVVLILTTNKTKEYFDTLDSSLFRRYRVTKSFKFDDTTVTEDIVPELMTKPPIKEHEL